MVHEPCEHMMMLGPNTEMGGQKPEKSWAGQALGHVS
jgi:hypothetical protein